MKGFQIPQTTCSPICNDRAHASVFRGTHAVVLYVCKRVCMCEKEMEYVYESVCEKGGVSSTVCM